jgi:hypothetical protein
MTLLCIKRSSLAELRYLDKYPTQPDYIGGPYRDAVLDAILLRYSNIFAFGYRRNSVIEVRLSKFHCIISLKRQVLFEVSDKSYKSGYQENNKYY